MHVILANNSKKPYIIYILMCTDCNKITIPIGPQGPAGTNGTNGVDGAPGTNGTNGTDGTNAFKFIKEFETDDIEQRLTITQEELTSCQELPLGCLYNGVEQIPITDLHVKVYFKTTNGWQEGVSRYASGPIPAGTYTYILLLVDPSLNPTNNIDIQLDNFIGRIRVVILG